MLDCILGFLFIWECYKCIASIVAIKIHHHSHFINFTNLQVMKRENSYLNTHIHNVLWSLPLPHLVFASHINEWFTCFHAGFKFVFWLIGKVKIIKKTCASGISALVARIYIFLTEQVTFHHTIIWGFIHHFRDQKTHLSSEVQFFDNLSLFSKLTSEVSIVLSLLGCSLPLVFKNQN